MKKVLTIAGSDCSGGAGIQADIKTITAHKMYAMSVITALTAQNTTGISGILEVSPDFVAQQLDMIFTDILPDAVKIGMVADSKVIQVIADKLKQYRIKNIVLDPVLISTSGRRLLKEEAQEVMLSELLPIADMITPNLSEAEFISGFAIKDHEDMKKAASELNKKFGKSVLVKGGHLNVSCDDLLYDGKESYWFEQPRFETNDTHGTGCTLSSAIACNLAEGRDIRQSVSMAKEYVTGAIQTALRIGHGNGPLNHCWNLK